MKRVITHWHALPIRNRLGAALALSALAAELTALVLYITALLMKGA